MRRFQTEIMALFLADIIVLEYLKFDGDGELYMNILYDDTKTYFFVKNNNFLGHRNVSNFSLF